MSYDFMKLASYNYHKLILLIKTAFLSVTMTDHEEIITSDGVHLENGVGDK